MTRLHATNRGLASGNTGNFDEAISDYTKAIGLDPNDASGYLNRGLEYGDKGNYDKASSDFTAKDARRQDRLLLRRKTLPQ
jgi:tetratricopeptide (TPR) repeat protein